MSDDGTQVWAPMEVVEGLLARAEQAEAALQRVRKVKRRTKNIYKDGFDVGWNACLAAVLRALDGGAE